ncbi:putative presenilins-associated rhomboid-like protein, mitochondrial [Apostichopus japonicus]|uniref:rhomboid protease n=1 Tax=Stichopus japonicus TaxID=307972 RepID=A0A2G8L768_STIJA|nr:putative presenilins-associated rhomboid-like protein, mitochondrial [Apostichopus japonicus]
MASSIFQSSLNVTRRNNANRCFLQHYRNFQRAEKGSEVSRKTAKEKRIIRANLESKSPEKIDVVYARNGRPSFRTLIRPFGFACLFTGGSFAGCAVWQYESMRSKATSSRIHDFAESFFATEKRGEFRNQLNRWYHSLSGTQKMVLGIIATNVAVFACWRVPALQMFMIRWFSASPAAQATCLPMVLSTFSQFSFWHLAINMYVLWSFTPTIGAVLGREQFLAFYLTGGVWASFASYAVKVATSSVHPSIGASGAIMAVLGAVCTHVPDATLSIILLPFITFSAGAALKGLVAFESLGVILRWKFFDHAAHLGGLLFGCYYVTDGHKRTWDHRGRFMERWHKFRGKPVDS